MSSIHYPVLASALLVVAGCGAPPASTEPDSGPTEHTLSVTITGPGLMRIVDEEGRLSCPGVCAASYPAGAKVKLTATGPRGTWVTGWSGACAGEGPVCELTLDGDRTARALTDVAGLWGVGEATGAEEAGTAVALTPDGDAVVAGSFSGTIAFGGPERTAVGPKALLVARLSEEDGAASWVFSSSGPGTVDANDLAVDEEGNVLVVGVFGGDVGFGCGTLTATGASDGFLLKLDGASGACLFARRLTGDFNDAVTGVVAAAGAVFVSGYSQVDGSYQYLLAAHSGADGAQTWCQLLGGSENDLANGIALGEGDTVVVAGRFSGAAIIDPYGAPPQQLESVGGSRDVFVAAYSRAAGVLEWGRSFGGPGSDQAFGIASSAEGLLYVVGQFQGTMTVGAQSLSAADGDDGFLIALDPAGEPRWARSFGGPGMDSFSTVAAVEDRVYVAGTFATSVKFDGEELLSAGEADILLARLGADGSEQARFVLGSDGPDEVRGLAAGALVAVTGSFEGTQMNLQSSLQFGAGGKDLFAATFAP